MSALRPFRVVLVRPRDPNNIGACARAMANFGLRDLVVVDPFEPVWRETRAAPDAESIVLEARQAATLEEAAQGCGLVLGTSSFHQRELEQAVVELPNLGRLLAAHPAGEGIAIVLGSERSGLSNEDLVRCQFVLRIPTQAPQPSMNLAQALAVVLYEIRRIAWEPPVPPAPAPSQELEPLIHTIAAVGAATDYPPGYTPEARLGRIRAALQDAILPPSTVRFLLSLLRWIHKKL